jgi:prepilin-type N-terminal cleavage/methylation domain-containing protein
MQIRHQRTYLHRAIANVFRLLLSSSLLQRLGRGAGNQGRKVEGLHMERYFMELNTRIRGGKSRGQRGMTLIELMISMVVLLVGVMGSLALIAYAIGGNSRNRQQSNATVIAQMLSEKISSQKATLAGTLTVYDCTNTGSTVNTAVGGGSLNSSGDVDMTQAVVAGYQMYYTDCGTGGRLMIYDVRWTITQPTTYTKLLVVTAKMKNAGTDAKVFALPVTIRTLVGQGT